MPHPRGGGNLPSYTPRARCVRGETRNPQRPSTVDGVLHERQSGPFPATRVVDERPSQPRRELAVRVHVRVEQRHGPYWFVAVDGDKRDGDFVAAALSSPTGSARSRAAAGRRAATPPSNATARAFRHARDGRPGVQSPFPIRTSPATLPTGSRPASEPLASGTPVSCGQCAPANPIAQPAVQTGTPVVLPATTIGVVAAGCSLGGTGSQTAPPTGARPGAPPPLAHFRGHGVAFDYPAPWGRHHRGGFSTPT